MIWQHLGSENIARAICLTLAHSLWQSALLAVLASMIILLTKNSSAATRHGWLVTALGMFTLAFLVTLVIELNSQNTSSHPAAVASPATSPLSGMFDACLQYSQDHAPMIVNCWLMIIAIRSLWLLLGFFSLGRMKRTRVQSPGPDLEALLTRLAAAVGISRLVILLESAIVKIPLTLGHLKPVILIPAGLLTGLGQREVEMILLHELSHILRKDYLINIFQRLVETFFFFNPAILWLSARIRVERENCVDDLVINHTQDRTGYIKALVHFEQYRTAIPTYALAFGGKGTLARIERIISRRSNTLYRWELFGLALLLAIGCSFAGFSPGLHHEPAKQTTISSVEKQQFEAKRKAEAAALARTASIKIP